MLSATRLITRRTVSIPAMAVQTRAMGGHAQSFVSTPTIYFRVLHR